MLNLPLSFDFEVTSSVGSKKLLAFLLPRKWRCLSKKNTLQTEAPTDDAKDETQFRYV